MIIKAAPLARTEGDPYLNGATNPRTVVAELDEVAVPKACGLITCKLDLEAQVEQKKSDKGIMHNHHLR